MLTQDGQNDALKKRYIRLNAADFPEERKIYCQGEK